MFTEAHLEPSQTSTIELFFAKIGFFFYLGILSCTFTIHRTAGEGGVYVFNSSLPLSPTSQTIRH